MAFRNSEMAWNIDFQEIKFIFNKNLCHGQFKPN